MKPERRRRHQRTILPKSIVRTDKDGVLIRREDIDSVHPNKKPRLSGTKDVLPSFKQKHKTPFKGKHTLKGADMRNYFTCARN